MEPIIVKAATSNLKRIPFDQYSRQFLIKDMVEKVVRPSVEGPARPLRIIDLGGHKGKSQEFFPEDEVTILDVFDEEYDGYIKGDATAMTFKDDEFDIAVSFDVIEHIPREKRHDFFREANRVSRYGVFTAAPSDNRLGTVTDAEKTLNDLYTAIHGERHPWLAEHQDYGLPTRQELLQTMEDIGVSVTHLRTNDLELWVLLQGVMFLSSRLQGDLKEAVDVSLLFNQNLKNLEDNGEFTYRTIYFTNKDKVLVSKMDAYITTAFNAKPDELHKRRLKLLDAVLQAMAAIAVTSEQQQLARDNEANRVMKVQYDGLNGKLLQAQEDHARSERALQDILGSKAWRVATLLQRVRAKLPRL
jgi:hypothetical protein